MVFCIPCLRQRRGSGFVILLILGAMKRFMNDEDYCGRTELLEAKEDKLSLGHHQHMALHYGTISLDVDLLYLSTEKQQQPQ